MTDEPTNIVHLDPPVEEIWSNALEILSKELKGPTFASWVPQLQFKAVKDDIAVLIVRNDFTKKYVVQNLLDSIEQALSRTLGRRMQALIEVDSSLIPSSYTPSIASIAVVPETAKQKEATNRASAFDNQVRSQYLNLNPKYTFETFVVGSNARFCHSASLAVADKPGIAYNPLFIYGGVGLGKTHLLHAIGQRVIAHNPNLSVRYISCERFTNDLVNSIRENRMIDFRKRYRQVDVLLMDDIQFIEGKESTQEEFFHTFNALRDSGKQIVLSSDRPPKAFSLLEERLKSRFEWGLITDIQPPDYETRLAILRKKSAEEAMNAPDSVLALIADSFSHNIRELEGALLRAHAYASLTNVAISMETAREALQLGQKPRTNAITIEQILDAVAAFYRIDPVDIKSIRRSQDLALPRHVAMYLSHEILSMSFPRIGQIFSNRKHTSVMYAVDKIKSQLPVNTDLSEAIRQIRHQIEL